MNKDKLSKKSYDWDPNYLEYCKVMVIEPSIRDEVIFLAGYNLAKIEHSEGLNEHN